MPGELVIIAFCFLLALWLWFNLKKQKDFRFFPWSTSRRCQLAMVCPQPSLEMKEAVLAARVVALNQLGEISTQYDLEFACVQATQVTGTLIWLDDQGRDCGTFPKDNADVYVVTFLHDTAMGAENHIYYAVGINDGRVYRPYENASGGPHFDHVGDSVDIYLAE